MHFFGLHFWLTASLGILIEQNREWQLLFYGMSFWAKLLLCSYYYTIFSSFLNCNVVGSLDSFFVCLNDQCFQQPKVIPPTVAECIMHYLLL